MAPTWSLVLPLVLVLTAAPPGGPAAAPGGAIATGAIAAAPSPGWAWPVVGPVIRAYDPPEDPYGSGHRGIDIGVPIS